MGQLIQGATSQDGAAATPKLLVNNDGGLSSSYDADVESTRSANTTAYLAGQVVGPAGSSGLLTFAGIGPAGGRVMVTSAELRYDVAAVPTGMTSFTLQLYNDIPAVVADGSAWVVGLTDKQKYVGAISLGSPAAAGGSFLWTSVDSINKQLRALLAGSVNLYGHLVTAGGWTPTSGATFGVILHTVAV